MIQKLGKSAAISPEIVISGTGFRPKSGAGWFVKGFAEGFGCVGTAFGIPQQSSFKKSLAVQLAQAPAHQRGKVATLAKRKMAAKYVGREMASKLCSISTGTGEGRIRRIDGLMIHQDFATAISKMHG